MEKPSTVFVVPCDSYEKDKVYAAMCAGIAAMGGLPSLIAPDAKVLVKPNFLTAAVADKAITTHPAVIEAMLRILQEQGYAHVTFGDSPGHGSCESAVDRLGFATYGARMADMDHEVTVAFSQGNACRSFPFARGVTEATAIINLCKMKTHMLERITGAVKNVYGFICGKHKAAGHVKYPDASSFARMLCDIHKATPIRLHIMDGIVAMEGNGPGSGDPTPMNVLLFSTDPVALDAVFCHLVYLVPTLVPTCVQGQLAGIGTYENIDVKLVTSDGTAHAITAEQLQEQLGKTDFDVDRKGTRKSLLGNFSRVMTRFRKRPYIQKDKCVKCGICVDHCPVPGKAVTFRNGKTEPPAYDYTKCIRCYCCQEMCPQHAIHVKGR